MVRAGIILTRTFQEELDGTAVQCAHQGLILALTVGNRWGVRLNCRALKWKWSTADYVRKRIYFSIEIYRGGKYFYGSIKISVHQSLVTAVCKSLGTITPFINTLQFKIFYSVYFLWRLKEKGLYGIGNMHCYNIYGKACLNLVLILQGLNFHCNLLHQKHDKIDAQTLGYSRCKLSELTCLHGPICVSAKTVWFLYYREKMSMYSDTVLFMSDHSVFFFSFLFFYEWGAVFPDNTIIWMYPAEIPVGRRLDELSTRLSHYDRVLLCISQEKETQCINTDKLHSLLDNYVDMPNCCSLPE